MAHSLSILLALRRTTSKAQQQQQSPKLDFKMWKSFFKRINNFKQHLATSTGSNEQSNSNSNNFSAVFELQNALEQNLTDAPVLVEHLQKFFRAQHVTLDMNNRLRQRSAVIYEPRNNVDNPLRFSAGLILAVDFVSSLYNIDDVSNIYLKVCFFSN